MRRPSRNLLLAALVLALLPVAAAFGRPREAAVPSAASPGRPGPSSGSGQAPSPALPPPSSMPPAPQAPPELAPPLPAPGAGAGSSVEKVAPGIFRIGLVTLDKNQRSVSFPAEVNMQRGLLEYLLVKSDGKTHESLLRTEAEPYHVQLACLLLGLEGTDRPLPFQGAPEKPRGEPVRITLSLRGGDGANLVLPAERWVAQESQAGREPVSSLSWAFTGSLINDGQFLAQLSGSLIALYHDPVAIVDNASPGGENDQVWFVREDGVPPVGTPVTVTIKPATEPRH